MATKLVERKPLSLAEQTYLPQIVTGLKITMKNMLKPPVTLEYPEERPEIPTGYRGVPTLVKDPNGREKCVSCQLCEFVCPPKAIRITPGEISEESENAHVEKAPREFEINMLRCIYCGYCQEVCPEEAIFLQDIYSLSGFSREEMVFKKKKLYEIGGTLPDNHFKWGKKKDAELSGNPHH
ncbi:NADH-quinone oxidoreductase subunit I [Puniceicoccales bacterium CK1056]|uniref:NADH-quinone oxidoreductase subunit I n=1 Tax=Oceanipulchritudo coccoides TaxID=2706888 RepID=A0A6B2M445_9BACT|nr:NADH-quinone oxidoreductase subunit I [Oceanipulchritudo coccoides]NDV62420.1 NADH-quinone oxidoreductase subunit I [Oceanipulchritudo coccoides]